ncbi:hypothetical protein E5D57_003614 [Metarhizium anisopliae]|nr:hypothetical protein E5D57_003614 [Metarhizium anisopliae]
MPSSKSSISPPKTLGFLSIRQVSKPGRKVLGEGAKGLYDACLPVDEGAVAVQGQDAVGFQVWHGVDGEAWCTQRKLGFRAEFGDMG